ncbi:hypothetical protein [Vibrio campbellii]|uniref:Uncharacterized protein n=1 Tax=Vibrio campbellii (strain ATCC BAA-1116) TaxID=2902295 RepID=A7MZK5_VIBC1|nr:hypothetical protein [Vibrio campbellii]ABU71440.1 hypothetical protein VIBHAR_02478 [Vibrio campbellii ATCC BAA-1116]AGU95968.1 hypothetical protein M892_01040 [Vibrio campbellii ATCC BAA-1116]MBT0122965.1 hypothetical protein [Vibrio campbellii]MBT0138023.1 hypothetical protein [Vibrio campbellii]MBT0142745.1 hypothetical protein [Vibrio campbellii]
METLNYQMDGESVQALRSIIGLECKVMMSSEGSGFESNTVTSLSPLFFQIPAGFIELSNDWYTSPQGHDFHLPIARFIHELNPKDVKAGQLEGVKLFEASKAIEFIEVFSLRSRKAVKENFTDKVFVPSSEVVIYDFGFNIVFVDGDCISIKTEDDSILGAWLISDEPIEPYHVEDIYEETLEARIRITS